jgi:hypothetical protein
VIVILIMEKFLSKDELLIRKLLDFYSDPQKLCIFIRIVEQGTEISLRLLDWFSTNYSKFNRVYINSIDIHSNYKDQLKGYKKEAFDPFCRRQRIFLYSEEENILEYCMGKQKCDKKIRLLYEYIDKPEMYLNRKDGIVTTVGQLNFFKWCLEKHIINYIIAHLGKIEKSMMETTKKSQKKRGLGNPVHKTMMEVVIRFS